MSEKMRDSGVDWIGEIPEGWEVTKIKFSTTLNGRIGWQGLTSSEYQTEGPYLITGTDFSNGQINFATAVHIENHRWEEAKHIQIKNGDLLITKDGTVGKVAIVTNLNDKASLNSGVLKIQPKPEIYTKFLYYVLISEEFWLWFNYTNSGASTILHLYQNVFDEFSYAIPLDIRQQKFIANYLDKQTSKFDQAQKLLKDEIERLRAYKKSLIYETVTKGLDKNVQFKDSGVDWIGEIPVGWEVSKLKFLSEGKLQYGANVEGVDFDKKLPRYIRITDITGDNKLKEKGKQSLPRDIATPYLLQKGDILFARSGATVGKTFLFESEESAAFAGYLIKFTPNQEKVDSKFVFYMTLGYGYENWKNSIFSQATIQNIGADKYGELKIAMPSLVEQLDIVKFLDEKTKKIDKIIKIKEEQVINLLKQQKNLIYEMVTGKKNIELGISNGSNG